MGVSDTAFAVWKTFAISVRALARSVRGGVTRDWVDETLATWSQALLARTRIDLHVHAEKPVDWSHAYVIMSNHQSHFDIPVLYAVVRGTLRMVAKAELFRLPIMGKAMREAEMVEVDRQDRSQAMASLRGAGDALKSGVHIWIAPEGTRSKTGALGPLKKGGFHLAREAGAQILPIAIQGTRDVLPAKGAIVKPGRRVDVTIGEPIPVTGRDTPGLMAEVKGFLERHLTR